MAQIHDQQTPLRHRSNNQIKCPEIRRTLGGLIISENVVLLFRLGELRTMSTVNLVIAMMCLWYIAVNICMVMLNEMDHNDDDCKDPDSVYIARCGSPVADYTFHCIEFWATFAFAVVQSIALVYTPKSASSLTQKPWMLKLVLFFDIIATFLSAMMVTLNLEVFEIISHEIEYANEITMSFVDLILLSSLMREHSPKADPFVSTSTASIIALFVAVIQIGVYNGMGETADGDKIGEKPAHFLEFAFEILSAGVTFWFCMDNKAASDREINTILYAEHSDCIACTGPMLWSAGPGVCTHQSPLAPAARTSQANGCQYAEHV